MIKIPYTVTADIAKYDGKVFNHTPNPYYLAQKQIELNKFGSGLGYTLIDGIPLVEDLSIYCGFKKTNDIREVALQLEEDIAVLYNGRLVSMCFCFPSGFRPMDKMGMTFMEMHAPVADRQKLDRASNKVVEMISKPGAVFRRYVWTLTTSSELSRHPHYKSFEPPVTTIDDLYFRNETQTTVGYNDGKTTFFFVKVDVTPFTKLTSERQQQAIDSINTMSDAVLEYKGLTNIKTLFQ
jgi:hypothetical protein